MKQPGEDSSCDEKRCSSADLVSNLHDVLCPRDMTKQLLSVCRLPPSSIRFTHDSISARFSCGRVVEDTFTELLRGVIDICAIPRLTVVWHLDDWFTYTGNRRLHVFRRLEEQGKLHEVEVAMTRRRLEPKKFTTKNMGQSVRVRALKPVS
ncbi:unnamed protein product [Effrenium voratum]|nr:unnamed protein product [Effrenium voratum]